MRGPRVVKILKTACRCSVHMGRFLDGEYRRQLLPANVHVKSICLDIEELARGAEVAKSTLNFDRRSAGQYPVP